MGYKGVVKDNAIVLEQGVKLPEGTEVEVIAQGWWMSEEARRNATDKKSFKRLLDECDELRKQMPKTTDSVQIIREMREERANR
ncbi:TPA: hypothetical protein ENX78_19680 [Candidatus Poribacteria bacterium]|nr:hypothetical protein [Candidatus Poribacteria bacterium]